MNDNLNAEKTEKVCINCVHYKYDYGHWCKANANIILGYDKITGKAIKKGITSCYVHLAYDCKNGELFEKKLTFSERLKGRIGINKKNYLVLRWVIDGRRKT